MKKTTFGALLALVSFLAFSASAQTRGAEALLRPAAPTTPVPLLASSSAVTAAPAAQPDRVSAVQKEKSRMTYSVHSRGFVGNYEVVTLRERGLWGNGCLTQVLVDNKGEIVAVLNSSASAGPGIAMVQGASFVGGMYLFAEHLRPSKVNSDNNGGTGNGTTVNNSNSAEGGSATGGSSSATGGSSSSTATGGSATATGTGGNATSTSTSTSTSTATGGNGNGGNGGHGGHVHPPSPGNGGIPGNGGQNGNGHNP
jgi:hypothetical protein